MKLSTNWLQDWIDLQVPATLVAEQLTGLGIEVESMHTESNDSVFDLSITPNRGDCLSVYGVARDLAAKNNIKHNILPKYDFPSAPSSKVEAIVSTASCSYYSCRRINSIDNLRSTPDWILARLDIAGVKAISPVVDILNYVMLDIGQPMHAFAADKITDKLCVRSALVGERIQLLNGNLLELSDSDLVICDGNKPQALAGVMGAMDSSVQTNTNSVILESANFCAVTISKTARRTGIVTDSSFRFERGVDPGLCEIALDYATKLIVDNLGGEAGPTTTVGSTKRVRDTILLSYDKLVTVAGFSIDKDFVTQSLSSLGMQVLHTADSWQVLPPSFRFDINLEEDLIEEVLRLYGLDNLPTAEQPMTMELKPELSPVSAIKKIKNTLATMGYRETITYSFIDAATQELFTDTKSPTLANPISQDLAVMRQQVLPSLLKVLKYNLHHQHTRVRLFELGSTYHIVDGKEHEEKILAGVVTGYISPEQWGQSSREADFYDIKNDIAILLQSLIKKPISTQKISANWYDPGQSCSLLLDGKHIGDVGRLHPQLLSKLDIDTKVFGFEIKLSSLVVREQIKFTSFSKYPRVRRDVAFLVPKSIAVGDMLAVAQRVTNKLLVDLLPFDLYEGKGVAKDMKSVAIGFIFQSNSGTLTDLEVDTEIDKVLTALKNEFQATLRE